jgi:hypothetical protein
MLNDQHCGCTDVGIPHFKAIKELLHSLHFCQILSHPIIIAVIFFLHLFCYQLGIFPNKESSNAEILGFRRNEHDTSPDSFESVGSIEVHHPMIM